MLIGGTNESGPPGTGVAWHESVRGVKFGDLHYFHGIGPFGQINAFVDRAVICQQSAADQLHLCLDNLLQRMRDSFVDRPLEPSLNEVRVIWLRLNDIADLPAIDIAWATRFTDPTQGPARSITVGEIRGGAKVELDAWTADLWQKTFRISANSQVPDEYWANTAEPSATDNGWLASLTGTGPHVLMNEQEVNNPNSRRLLDYAPGLLAFARWDEKIQGWSAHTAFSKARPAESTVAWPQYFYFNADVNPQVFTTTLSGWDIAGPITGYEVSATGLACTVVNNGDWTVTATVVPTFFGRHEGQSWFTFRVFGPSGSPSAWQKIHAMWWPNWGIVL